MKKAIFMISFCLLGFLNAAAQNESEVEFSQKRYNPSEAEKKVQKKGISVKQKQEGFELSIGPRLGGGIGIVSQGDGLDIAKGSSFGFDVGLAANIRFGGKDSKGRPLGGKGLLGVGLELNYAYKNVGTNGSSALSFNSFEIPVLVQLYPGFKSKSLRNLYFEVGPTFSMLLSSSPKELDVNGLSYATGNFKGGDLKVTLGLGYRVTKSANSGFYVNFRYNLGTSNLAGNFPMKLSTAELTLGYLFRCAGGIKSTADKKKQVTNKNINKIQF